MNLKQKFSKLYSNPTEDRFVSKTDMRKCFEMFEEAINKDGKSDYTKVEAYLRQIIRDAKEKYTKSTS